MEFFVILFLALLLKGITMILGTVIGLGIGFVAGVLVGRKNRKSVEAAVIIGQAEAAKASEQFKRFKYGEGK